MLNHAANVVCTEKTDSEHYYSSKTTSVSLSVKPSKMLPSDKDGIDAKREAASAPTGPDGVKAQQQQMASLPSATSGAASAGINPQSLAFLNSLSAPSASGNGEGGGAATNQQYLLPLLYSLLEQRGDPSAFGSGGLGSQFQQQQQAQIPGGFSAAGFLPQLLQNQAIPAPLPPPSQQFGGLGNQQLLALLLPQQQNKNNDLVQALGSLSGINRPPASTQNVDIASLLSILASSDNSQKTAPCIALAATTKQE